MSFLVSLTCGFHGNNFSLFSLSLFHTNHLIVGQGFQANFGKNIFQLDEEVDQY
jgi:hypothetical protein